MKIEIYEIPSLPSFPIRIKFNPLTLNVVPCSYWMFYHYSLDEWIVLHLWVGAVDRHQAVDGFESHTEELLFWTEKCLHQTHRVMWNLELSVEISGGWWEGKLSEQSWGSKLGQFYDSLKDIICLIRFLFTLLPLMMSHNEGKKEEARNTEREQGM